MGYRNYSTANGFLVDKLGNGDFTTIGAALTAAVSGDTIFIRPGTYTENPTLKAGVNLCAFPPTGAVTFATSPSNVIINGTCTFTGTGNVGIYGITLQTNSSYALAITGSNDSNLTITDCFFNCSNNTGISFTTSNASSFILIENCFFNLLTTGIAIYSSSSPGQLDFINCSTNNTGASTTASNNSAGTVRYYDCSLMAPISTSSTGNVTFSYCNCNTSSVNTTTLTTAGTGANNIAEYSDFDSGTASAISIGAGTTLTVLGPINAFSSNTNAITGTGTIKYSLITYGGTSSTNNVTTQTALTTQPAVSSGVVVQQVRNTKTAAQTISNNIAAITTTPTTSTGSSIVQVTITPTNSSHILVIEGVMVATSAGNNYGCYIIQNTSGNSIATSWTYGAAANVPNSAKVLAYITAGGTSAITFDLYGFSVGTDTYVNANTSATQLSGGTATSTLTVTEYTS